MADNQLSRAEFDRLRWKREREFQLDLVRALQARGRLVDYTPDWMFRLAMTSLKRQRRTDRDWPDPGAPDLWTPDPASKTLWILELKTDTGRLSPVQVAWRDALEACDQVKYRLLRPRDWTGDIETTL